MTRPSHECWNSILHIASCLKFIKVCSYDIGATCTWQCLNYFFIHIVRKWQIWNHSFILLPLTAVLFFVSKCLPFHFDICRKSLFLFTRNWWWNKKFRSLKSHTSICDSNENENQINFIKVTVGSGWKLIKVLNCKQDA